MGRLLRLPYSYLIIATLLLSGFYPVLLLSRSSVTGEISSQSGKLKHHLCCPLKKHKQTVMAEDEECDTDPVKQQSRRRKPSVPLTPDYSNVFSLASYEGYLSAASRQQLYRYYCFATARNLHALIAVYVI